MAQLNRPPGLTAWIVRRWNTWRWPLLLTLLLLILLEIAWLTFLTPDEADLAHYQCYGLTFWLGSAGAYLLPPARCAFLHIAVPQPPLHMLPQEYPPLTLLLFSFPLLAPLPNYALAFALLMTLLAGLVYWLLARSDTHRAAPIFLLYLLLGTVGVFQERFDLAPAACTLVCVLAAERGRWRVAYLALALGVLLKLYPIVMLPALFLSEQRTLWTKQDDSGRTSWPARAWDTLKRWRWRNALLCAGLLLIVTGGFALLNFHDAILSPLSYFLGRPPQIESLTGSLIWLGGHLGIPSTIDFAYGSLNISSGLGSVLAPASTLLTLAGLLTVLWLQWRERLDLAESLTGLVCVLIITGKVFSPQYLLWLIPLLALLAGRGQIARPWLLIWAAVCLLTTFIYVFYYSRLPDPHTARQVVQTLPGFFELVALRNLLLLVATLAFFGGWWAGLSCSLEKLNN